jgi:hypothetical protein
VKGLLRNKTSDFWCDFYEFNPLIFCFSETMLMYEYEWREDRFNTKYNVHSFKATRGAKGRPSGGLLFGWKNNVDAVILDTNENFALILVSKMIFFFFRISYTYVLICT